MTVAPMMPMAKYEHALSGAKLGLTRAGPISAKLGWVCGRTKISMK